ncbi:uncharacterized protein LOC143614229 [Bidens hawaiensis]|uniref:uncharacterized protein LOC143614229 n=1 Tax=Bidens hawaiensis TaxID=980011 RepID=UPI004048EEB6
MSKLTPGSLSKLLDGMNSGVKPTSEHRNTLLQVTDIMPVDLDEKDLWPKQGFCVKVSDSSHSVYVSLPADLVLSNQIQLGQFVFVEKLEPGSPVPVAKGVKPVPGRQVFVGMPEPLPGFNGKGEIVNKKVVENLDRVSSLNPKFCTPKRGSWVADQKVNHDVCASPAKVRSSMNMNMNMNLNPNGKLSGSRRSSWVIGPKSGHGICEKSTHFNKNMNLNTKVSGSRRSSWVIGPKREHGICESSTPFDHCTPAKKCCSVITESPVIVNKSCVSSSMVKMLRSPNSAVGKINVTPSSSQSTRVLSTPRSSPKTSLSFNLPQKLSLLGKEAVQQQERAQKIAHQSLRNASATETLVWSLKTLSALTKSANLDDPTDGFEQFLDFHNQIVQAITNMVSMKAATETANKELKDTQILHDTIRKYPLHTSQQKSTVMGKKSTSPGSLTETIKLGKQIEKEAGNWLMEFLEKSMEKGMKKSNLGGKRVPRLVLKKVVTWVETEQCDSSKRPVHPKAVDIARKLRIKLRSS